MRGFNEVSNVIATVGTTQQAFDSSVSHFPNDWPTYGLGWLEDLRTSLRAVFDRRRRTGPAYSMSFLLGLGLMLGLELTLRLRQRTT